MPAVGRCLGGFTAICLVVMLVLPVADTEAAEPVPLYFTRLQEYQSAQEKEDEDDPVFELVAYTIQPGDTLSAIAGRFNTDLHTLIQLNGIINPHLIFAGRDILILTVNGTGATLQNSVETYGIKMEAILAAARLRSEPLPDRGDIRISSLQSPPSGFMWPVSGRLSSPFGWRNGRFHYGIDLAVPLGTPFYATNPGEVKTVGYRGSYGLLVEVEHASGWSSRYAHAGEAAVDVGETVAQGQVLGYVGLTGNTTGPHLHFEILYQGERVDPIPLLSGR